MGYIRPTTSETLAGFYRYILEAYALKLSRVLLDIYVTEYNFSAFEVPVTSNFEEKLSIMH